MRYSIIFLLSILPAVAQTPTVTITGTDGLSHSDVRVKFDVSGSYDQLRLRFIASPGTCAGGTGGTIQGFSSGLQRFTSGMTAVLGGLAASTTYNICPETTNNGGASWSTGASVAVTTAALPSPHPALPIAPATFDTNYPDTTGYTTVTVASNCSDLQSRIDTAVGAQASTGTIIQIPAGTVCSAARYSFTQKAADVVTFAPSQVTVTGGSPNPNSIHVVGHGLSEGQTITFGRQYGNGAWSGLPATTSCEFGQGMADGQTYTVHKIDNNYFGVNCTDGTPMVFTSQGYTNQYLEYVSFPRKLKWIIIRTSTPDSQLPPEHTRMTPAWLSKMATLQDPASNLPDPDGFNSRKPFLFFGDSSADASNNYMTGNIRIGPGIEITVEDVASTHHTSDPDFWGSVMMSPPWTSNIVFDRIYYHGLGAPSRFYKTWFWDGHETAIVDSYFDNLTYFHGMIDSALWLNKTDATHFTIDPGVENVGQGKITLGSTVTATISGSGTGVAYAYFDLANSNALTVSVPANVTVSCSPACATATAGSSNGSCALWRGGRDGWPQDANGNPTAGPIGCVNISAGSITSVQRADAETSKWNAEGASFAIMSNGPGPYIFKNNFTSGAGLNWHHDEGGGTTYIRGDMTYQRNTFKSPFTYMFSHPESDGMRYYHRQPLEWKSGRRINITGNIFDGSWVEDSGVAGFVVLSSVAGEGITDADITNNTFMHGPGLFQAEESQGGAITPPPMNRIRMYNNLAFDINALGPVACPVGSTRAYWVPQGGATCAKGWFMEGPSSSEDIIIDHNTVVGMDGLLPSIFWTFGSYTEGVQYTNNFTYLWSASHGAAQDGDTQNSPCSGQGGTLASCIFPRLFNFSNNVLMSGDMSQAAVNAAWPGGLNFVPSNMALSSVGWLDFNQAGGNYRLKSSSNYISGGANHAGDGLDVGIDANKLEAAQGKVTLIGVPEAHLGSTSAIVAFVAPDSMGCPVDYSTSDPSVITSFTRASDSGGARPRNITLSGLTSKTLYYYRVNCAVEQPTGQFRTH